MKKRQSDLSNGASGVQLVSKRDIPGGQIITFVLPTMHLHPPTSFFRAWFSSFWGWFFTIWCLCVALSVAYAIHLEVSAR